MYKLSEIAGKEVIGAYEAKKAGRLVNALFSSGYKKLKYFEVDNGRSAAFFPPQNVICSDKDAIIVKNFGGLTDRFSLPPTYLTLPVNLEAYGADGEFLGVVSDVVTDGDNVSAICVGDKAFPPDKLVSYSDDMLIFAFGEKVKPVPPAKKREKRTEPAPAATDVTVQPDAVPEEKPEKVDVPMKVASTAADDGRAMGYAFLLGKLVTRTILGDNGTVIAAEGSTIGEAQLSAAQGAGKLVQLALHSR